MNKLYFILLAPDMDLATI